MKLNFGITDWWTLTRIEHSIRVGSCKNEKVAVYRREVQRKLLDGLARAIRSEINRVEMAGGSTDGQVTFELDLKIVGFNVAEPMQSSHNMLVDFEKILSRKPPVQLLEW